MGLLGAAAGVGALAFLADGADATRTYWGTNIPGFEAGDIGSVVFTNMGALPQSVQVTSGSGVAFTTSLAPGTTYRYDMPVQPPTFASDRNREGYRFVVDDYVLVAQFNPIDNTFTNDAYRLLSEAELGVDHFTYAYGTTRGTFVAVVARQPFTQVTFTATANIVAGTGVLAQAAGTTQTYMMDAYDTIIFMSTNGDITGSRVQSNVPVAVISGSVCANVGLSACDHLSEQVLPTSAAGTVYPICSSMYVRPSPTTRNDRLRITAIGPGSTTVTLAPSGATTTIPGPGQWREMTIFSDQVLTASGPVTVAQYYADSVQPPGGTGYGDPSMIIHHSLPNHKAEQQLYAPVGWVDYLFIAAPTGTSTDVDGVTVPAGDWRPIPGTAYQCASVTVADGPHLVQSTQNTSVQVLGIMVSASYWYLADVGIPPVPSFPCTDTAVPPGAPTAFSAVETPPGSQTIYLDWGPPATNGGCPLIGYEVQRQRATDPPVVIATYSAMPPALPQDFHWDSVTETCQDYRWTVRAWTNFSFGPWAPWETLSFGGPPVAPTVQVSQTNGGLRFTWTSNGDGGCPLTDWRLEGSSILTGTVRHGFDANTMSWEIDHDPCYAFVIQVHARNMKGAGPWSAVGRFEPDMGSQYCRASAPAQADADDDGVPDGHDNCPFVANPNQELAPDGTCPQPASPADADSTCTQHPGVDRVQATPQADATVRITWTVGEGCALGRVTVWDAGRLVAEMPLAGGDQAAVDAAPSPATHVYHVQVDGRDAALAFVEMAAVPSNWIDLCEPVRLLGACPRSGLPEPRPDEINPAAVFVPHEPPAPPAEASTSKSMTSRALPWLLGALAAAAVAVGGLVAWRRMRAA